MVYVHFNFLLMVYIHNSFLFMINYNCCRLYESIRQIGLGRGGVQEDMTTIEPVHAWPRCLWDQPCIKRSREFEFSCVVEHLWRWHSIAPMFGNMGAFTSGEHFFYREVFKHLQFHPQCQKKQVECRSGRELGLCSLQLAIVVPLL
jgi:hypothetical protein